MPKVVMPATISSIVFARQVIQISFISYFEANIYLFIYLFIYSYAKAHIYSRKHVFYQKLNILKLSYECIGRM